MPGKHLALRYRVYFSEFLINESLTVEIFGYFLFLLMGSTLGLIGAGGAILTIPILVYLFKIPVILSTTYTLFIVGSSSLFGALRYKNNILFKKALLFATPSVTGIFVARFYIVHNLPEKIFTLSRDSFLLLLLVTLMLSASYLMIKNNKTKKTNQAMNFSVISNTIVIGLFIGSVMGTLGVGGGFLIIPTLVLILGLEMKQAVATSLFIIMLNSTVGFCSDACPLDINDYKKLLFFTTVALCGMWFGTYMSSKILAENLKKVFGFVIAFIACLIAVNECCF